jgi:hypothetical protein
VQEINVIFYLIQAYQGYKKKLGGERLLPGLNATNDQLFFLGFAQVKNHKCRPHCSL